MTATIPPATPPPWSPLVRIGFRFALIYFVLYTSAHTSLIHDALWMPLVSAFGELLGVEVHIQSNGSGDTTFGVVQVFAIACLAALGSLVWSLLDREREAYPRLGQWFRAWIRYFLGFTILAYGFAKVFMLQFPQPDLAQLMQPIGDSSPMGLAWTFTGFSPTYQVFAGLLECVGGLLLLWRRTACLGALLCAGVLTHVVMLNFCFDIPVKLLSSHLLILALALVAVDGRRLLAVLLGYEATTPIEFAPHFDNPKLHVAGRVLKVLLIAPLLALNLYFGVQNYHMYGPDAPRSPLYGIYEITDMREDGQPRPGLISDGERWRYLIFDRPNILTVQTIDGDLERYRIELDVETGTMQWEVDSPEPAPPTVYAWRITGGEPGRLQFTGEFEGRRIELQLEAHEPEFLLTSRGFHLINEAPLNH